MLRLNRVRPPLLNSVHGHNKAFNQKCFLKILQNVQFLERQGIALRGHHEEESNFIQLCRLRAHNSNEMSRWLDKKGDKYLSPDIQNELIQLMSSSMLESIASDIECQVLFNHGKRMC